MLVANRMNGKRLSLGDKWDKKNLSAIRSKEKFSCPECNEEVILKLGSKRIWHFSHQSGSSCQNQYERESEYHLSGKLLLYHWLRKQGIHAELEKFDPLIRQRPDIAFDWQGQKYAIEFQCSVIPEELFVKRTNKYLEYGYKPIWLAAASLIKRTGKNTISANNFLYLFLRRPRRSWNIPAFCPITSQFINLHGALPVSSRKTITHLEVHSITEFSLDDLLCPAEKHFPKIKTWQIENQKVKSRYFVYPGAHQNPFLKELYQNRLSLLTLPPEIGLPVPSSPYIETPAFIWQTYLYLDVFRHFKRGDMIKYGTVREAFLKRVKRGHVQLRILPVAGHGDYLNPLAEYVLLLVKISIMSRLNSATVKINREIKIYKTIQEQIESETEFFSQYQNKVEESFIK